METWFLANGADWRPNIEAVEVDKHTKNSVYVRGLRLSKMTARSAYFPTWEEAHEYLMNTCTHNLVMARRRLELSQSYLGHAKGMKNPSAD